MGAPYAEVIGDPVAHSKSPLIHEYWLSRLGIPGEYRRAQVRPSDLAAFLDQRRHDPDWRGCNVTVPHKEAVIAHLDRLDDRAAAIEAVNCVVPARDGLVGYNSDVDGVAAALDGLDVRGAKAALIGAGGAARAALACLAERGVDEIGIAARHPDRAEPLRSLVPEAGLTVGPFGTCPALFKGAAVIINASPLGMTGCPPMPDEVIAAVSQNAEATLFDMVYSPIDTRFLTAGQGRRINGFAMLVGQASRAFELLFHRPAPAADAELLHRLGTAPGARRT